MENLITLIIIIITIVSIFKSRKPPKPKTTSKPTTTTNTGMVEKLTTILNQIQTKLEEQSATNKSDNLKWDRMIDEEELINTQEPSLADLVLMEEDDKGQEKKSEPPPVESAELPGKLQLITSEPPLLYKVKEKSDPKATAKPAQKAAKPKIRASHRKRARLRKAIIWSEIIGPPVSLKGRSTSRR